VHLLVKGNFDKTSSLQELVQLQHLGAALGPKTAEAGAGASICG